jgi:hypothetical protein
VAPDEFMADSHAPRTLPKLGFVVIMILASSPIDDSPPPEPPANVATLWMPVAVPSDICKGVSMVVIPTPSLPNESNLAYSVWPPPLVPLNRIGPFAVSFLLSM